MYGIGRKQNPKESPLHIKKRNWIISNRLSVIQIQHRKSVLGHSVHVDLLLLRLICSGLCQPKSNTKITAKKKKIDNFIISFLF